MLPLLNKLFEPRSNGPEIAKFLVDQLKVRISAYTLKNEIEEHPDYPGLLSISDVLRSYGIENITASFKPDNFPDIPTPFITQIQKEKPINGFFTMNFFTIVKKIDSHETYFFDPERHSWTTCATENFLKRCSGIALLADAGEASGEKEYKQRIKEEVRQRVTHYLSTFCIPAILITVGIASLIQNGTSALLPFVFSLLSLAGSIAGVLLLWYDIDQYNPLLQKICSTGSKVNCSAVLQSKVSKIAGISWSILGFIYFVGGLFLLVFAGIVNTNALLLLSWLNLLAMPYVFFSIYYQWKVIKQWCVLCLFVQGLLVMQLITALIGGWLALPPIMESQFVVQSIAAFALPAIIIAIILPALRNAKERRSNRNELQRLKHNPLVFEALLKKQKTIETATDGLGILLGNPNATQKIIKVCSPYCDPCAEAYIPMEDLLENNQDLQLQIIFAGTNRESDIRTLPISHLLSIAEKQDERLTKQALGDWYLSEKKNYEEFASRYPIEGVLEMQSSKVDAMSAWCRTTGISGTPTFFVNGFQLPGIYSVNDLKYFISNE